MRPDVRWHEAQHAESEYWSGLVGSEEGIKRTLTDNAAHTAQQYTSDRNVASTKAFLEAAIGRHSAELVPVGRSHGR